MARTTTPATFSTFRILYGALVSSSFVYLLVVQQVAFPPTPPDVVFPIALAAVALGTAGASFFVPKLVLDAAYRAMPAPRIVEVPDQSAQNLFRDQVPMRRVFDDASAARAAVLRVSLAPFILGLALTESIAIYGLVLRFLGYGWGIVLPFFVVAWALFLVRFPREPALYADAERRLGARFE